MTHPRANLLSLWELGKLENKLFTSKIQWWGRQLLTSPFLKGEEGKKKGVKFAKFHQVSRPGNNRLWLEALPSGPMT